MGFTQEFVRTRVPALERVSSEYELFITEGRPFLLSVCS